MAEAIVQASAPGTLMLLGEHAVLHGRMALACAVTQRVHVRLRPIAERRLRVKSALGCVDSGLDAPQFDGVLTFVEQVLSDYAEQMTQGCELVVESDMSSTVGLGTSAATTVAVLAAVRGWLGMPVDADSLFAEGRRTIQAVQGCGSGTDVAASVYGGVTAYQMDAGRLSSCPAVELPLRLIYCGYKKPTAEVICMLEMRRMEQPDVFEDWFDEMDAGCRAACDALEQRDVNRLGRIDDKPAAHYGGHGAEYAGAG